MRPTFSIILFTVLSGAGYGLWFLVALLLLAATLSGADTGDTLRIWPSWFGSGLALGFVLVSIGLLSSLGHLGKPLRAWRAFSQWRSSWLSREGVSAVLTYLPVLAIALYAVSAPRDAWLLTLSAVLLLLGSLATTICTANIYACLKPIAAWNNRYVVAGYLLLGLHCGALLAWVLASLHRDAIAGPWLLPFVVMTTGIGGALLKSAYWRFIDREPGSTTAHAIGLDHAGNAGSFEHPHTQANYLTTEMGFRVARKHSRQLRGMALLGGFLLPAALALAALAWPAGAAATAWPALLAGLIGVFVERWLFFAEARHTVMLYYGARRVP